MLGRRLVWGKLKRDRPNGVSLLSFLCLLSIFEKLEMAVIPGKERWHQRMEATSRRTGRTGWSSPRRRSSACRT